MRVSREQAAANRERVIEVASRLFRERGFDGIGLAELMKGAGLTHGGFYKQFASKEDLAVKACSRAVSTTQERWRQLVARKLERPLEALVRAYLSARHRDAKGEGCFIAALGMDAARAGSAIRAPLEDGVESFVAVIESLLPGDDVSRREHAMAVASTMVGALVLSRAVNDKRLSDTILDAATEDILGRPEFKEKTNQTEGENDV